MKSAGAIQAVIILLLVASAASCEVGKEYTNRVFKPAPKKKPDTTVLRFMQFDSGNPADSIDLKNFTNKEKKESSEVELSRDTSKTEVVIMENKKAMPEKPIDATKRGTTRTKRTRQ